MVANNTRLTYHYTRTMIYGEILTYLSPRVDVYTRYGMGLLCDNTWQHGHPQLMQAMGYAIVYHRINNRIAKYNLTIVRGSRVIIEHSLYVSIYEALNLR